jgi:hypothetical protein
MLELAVSVLCWVCKGWLPTHCHWCNGGSSGYCLLVNFIFDSQAALIQTVPLYQSTVYHHQTIQMRSRHREVAGPRAGGLPQTRPFGFDLTGEPLASHGHSKVANQPVFLKKVANQPKSFRHWLAAA